MFHNVHLLHHKISGFHFRSLEYLILSDEFEFKRLCENEMRRCLYTVYQLSKVISIYENEIIPGSAKLIFPY